MTDCLAGYHSCIGHKGYQSFISLLLLLPLVALRQKVPQADAKPYRNGTIGIRADGQLSHGLCMLAYCHSASMLLRYGCSKALVVEHRQGLAADYGATIFMRGGKAMVIGGATSVGTDSDIEPSSGRDPAQAG